MEVLYHNILGQMLWRSSLKFSPYIGLMILTYDHMGMGQNLSPRKATEFSRHFYIHHLIFFGSMLTPIHMLPATTIVTPVSPRAPYILGSQKSFGPRSWPVLCGVVQGVAIFASRAAVAVAARQFRSRR